MYAFLRKPRQPLVRAKNAARWCPILQLRGSRLKKTSRQIASAGPRGRGKGPGAGDAGAWSTARPGL
jgi:hypothetical protein